MTTKQETTFPFNTSITGNDALFNDYSLMTHPLLPTTTSTPQDLSHLLQLDSNQPFVIDDWLATELHQSGLLPPTSSGSSTSSGVSSPELPNSPPLTASPPSKESTSPIYCTANTLNVPTKTTLNVPLVLIQQDRHWMMDLPVVALMLP